ncbi:hypothetical protein [Alicyclobacillus mengziensis]|uniref:YfhO family protein n=1 Tax=Alicyclobacillus mengziensis TaxID=2931921 RepID=A0A9X7VVY7_9BACL|nr:hypothetical protein [Alicyclobacillus mengziensis]QSO46074.1 hypothetical protein JZ786_16285 [Alicyclobacillus mengziensis]
MSIQMTQTEPIKEPFTSRRPLQNAVFLLSTLLIACLPALLLFSKVIASPTNVYIGRNQDSGQFMWYLGWFWHAIFHGLNPFVTTNLNYPHGVNLIWNTSIVTEAILFGPLVYLVNPVLAFNALVAFDLISLGVLGTLILKKLGVRSWVAVFSGALFECSPAIINQLVDGHVNLTSAPVFLLLALYLGLHVVMQRPRKILLLAILTGLSLAMEFYSSSEVFTTTVITFVVFLILALLLNFRNFVTLTRNVPLRFYLGTALTAITLILPGLFVYFFGPYRTHIAGPLVPYDHWVTNLFHLFIPTQAQLLHSKSTEYVDSLTNVNLTEINGYLGIPMLISVIWAGTRMWSNKYIQVLTLSMVFIVLLSMGPHLHILGITTSLRLPWFYIGKLPIIGDILPSRLMIYADIACVISVALSLEHSLQEGSRVKRGAAVMMVLLALILTWLPNANFPRQTVPPSVSAVEREGALYPLLKGHPTTIITANYWTFGFNMQFLAEDNYTIPVNNVYAFPYTSYAEFGRLQRYAPNQFLFSSTYYSLSDRLALRDVEKYIQARSPQRFLYIGTTTSAIPKPLYQALTDLCGKPVQTSHDVVWLVPKHLD